MKTGRPRLGEVRQPVRPTSLSLTDEAIERLKEIGEGNMSEGVRRALEAFWATRDQALVSEKESAPDGSGAV